MGRLSPGVGGARGGKTENKRAGQQSQEHGLHWSQEVRLEAHGSTLGVRPGRGPGNAVGWRREDVKHSSGKWGSEFSRETQ